MPPLGVHSFREEGNIRVLLGIILPFYAVNVSLLLGAAYALFLYLDWNIEQDRRFASYLTFSGIVNGFEFLFTMLVSYAGFLILAFVITSAASMQVLLQFLLQETAPLLARDPWLNLFFLGFIGPVIETRFFWRVVEWLSFVLRQPIALNSLGTWIIFSVGGTLASLFHFAAKLGSSAALFITFIFFTLSFSLIAYKKRLLEGKVLHIFNNMLLRVLAMLGYLKGV